jgi:hypothetical protein
MPQLTGVFLLVAVFKYYVHLGHADEAFNAHCETTVELPQEIRDVNFRLLIQKLGPFPVPLIPSGLNSWMQAVLENLLKDSQ